MTRSKTPPPRRKSTPAPGIAVDARNRAPLYHQIFLILRSRIHDGAYHYGDYLPGEYELARDYNVSRITAVRALNELAAAGLVVRERGRGTRVQFVAAGTVVRGPLDKDGRARPVAANGAVENFIDALRAREGGAAEIIAFDYMSAPHDVAAALGVSAKSRVQRAVRILRFAGEPWNHLTTWVPAEIGRTWTRAELEKSPLVALIERGGVVIARIEERVTATLADMNIADRLGVAAGAPLIKITRTAFDEAGRAVEHVQAHYPPERYQYAVTLTRAAARNRR